jgi:hypothetical protein
MKKALALNVVEVLDHSEIETSGEAWHDVNGIPERYTETYRRYEGKAISLLRQLWQKLDNTITLTDAEAVVLVSGFCGCCDGGINLENAVAKLRKQGFTKQILAVPVAGHELEIDLSDLPGVRTIFRPENTDEILQLLEV